AGKLAGSNPVSARLRTGVFFSSSKYRGWKCPAGAVPMRSGKRGFVGRPVPAGRVFRSGFLFHPMPVSLLNPSAAAIRALDTLLLREPWARERLRPHAGKTACLVAGGLRLALTVTPHGLVRSAAAGAVPDVTLTVDGGRLP